MIYQNNHLPKDLVLDYADAWCRVPDVSDADAIVLFNSSTKRNESREIFIDVVKLVY